MSFETSPDQWLNWGISEIERVSGQPQILHNPTGEPLKRPTQDQIEGDPAFWLEYFGSEMSYFAVDIYLWNSVAEYLDKKYDQFQDQETARNKGAKGSAAATRVKYAKLQDAITIAKIRLHKCKTEFLVAETFKEIISRVITTMEKEKRGNKW